MRSNVFDDIEIYTPGSLASKSPIGIFHSAENYTAQSEGLIIPLRQVGLFRGSTLWQSPFNLFFYISVKRLQ